LKALVTPRSFAKNDDAPLRLLRRHGVEPLINPEGGVMNEAQMKKHIAGCRGVIIGVDPLGADVLAAAPELKAVSKYGVGVDNIDLAYCAEKGIKVTRTEGANSEAVADYAFALMLGLARKLIEIDRGCRRGDWGKIITGDVARRRLGLLGLGAIGKQMVRRAKGFAMELWAHDNFWDDDYAEANGVRRAGVDEICRHCDFISLHLPLTEDTRHIIGRAQIEAMKPTAFLINTARGGLIDDDALLEALKEGRIAGAGLDAFTREPPETPDWYASDNVIIGSHCAASTVGASGQMSLMAARNLLSALELT
jgi:D-3-phosphoglycerate dehydrogenase